MNEIDYSNPDKDKEKLINKETYSDDIKIIKDTDNPVYEQGSKDSNMSVSRKNVSNDDNQGRQNSTSNDNTNEVNTGQENKVDNSTNANANSDINNDLTKNATNVQDPMTETNVKEVDNTQSNVNKNITEKEPLCFKIHYNFKNPNDSKIELCEPNKFDGGKTQKKKRSLKPLKRKTIHKKLKFRKTPKKKHPRRRSIRK